MASSFPSSPSWFSSGRRHPEISPWVHPLVRFTSPAESLASLPARRLPAPGTSLGVSLPHRGTKQRSPPCGALLSPGVVSRASQARFVPSSTFLTSSTASSSTAVAGLFHPAATSGLRSSGSFPRVKPYGLVARRCPRAVSVCRLPPVLPMGSSASHPPSGPCSAPESVANRGGLDHDPPATLLSFRLPRVPLQQPRARFHALSGHGLSRPSPFRRLPTQACSCEPASPVQGSRP